MPARNTKRGSEAIIRHYREIMEVVVNSEAMNRIWSNYRKDFDYSSDIGFSETCDAVARIMDKLQ